MKVLHRFKDLDLEDFDGLVNATENEDSGIELDARDEELKDLLREVSTTDQESYEPYEFEDADYGGYEYEDYECDDRNDMDVLRSWRDRGRF